MIEVARVTAMEADKASKKAHIRLPSEFQYGIIVRSKDNDVGKNTNPVTIPTIALRIAIFPGMKTRRYFPW